MSAAEPVDSGVGPPATPARRVRDVPVPAGFDMGLQMPLLGAGLAGSANFTMQLAWPAVGYGVANSRVRDGSALYHPIKRARTTFTYLAVAMLGTEQDRADYRHAVNGQHAQVVSEPHEEVQYRAMDPRLQTWVAACLYYGTVDVIEKMHGPLDDQTADAMYAHCGRFGTTLQMPADAWPATRADFDRYWEASLAEVRIDPPVRDHLMKLIRLGNMPRLLRPAARFNVFVTAGFLPPLFREQTGLSWSESDQRRFDRLMRWCGRVERLFPRRVRAWPFRILLADMRMRRRFGWRLV